MEILSSLFQRAKISYIVSVDDCYYESESISMFEILEHMTTNRSAAIQFLRDIEEPDQASIAESLDQSDLSDYLTSICADINPSKLKLYEDTYLSTTMNQEHAALASFCEKLKTAGYIKEYVKISTRDKANSLFESIEELFDVDSENKVLWLIDNDLTKGGGTTDSGTVLIQTLVAQSTKKPYNVFALTSSHVGDLDNEGFRKSIANQIVGSKALLVCVISKNNILEENYTNLYGQMSIGFRENYSGVIIEELQKIFSTATDQANRILQEFGNETIHKVFFESGKSEGVSPVDVFQRLLLVIIKKDISKSIAQKYDDISKIIYDYSHLCEWCGIIKRDERDFEIIRETRIAECYDEFINSKYSPVSYGDIFVIGGQYFILIGQACNLVLRDNGKRTAQCATLANVRLASENDKPEQGKYTLKYFRNYEDYCIDFNNCINADFNVLDLCSINNSGELKMQDQINIDEVKHRYPKSVFIRLKSAVEENQNLINRHRILAANYKNQSLDEIGESLREIYKDNSLHIKPSFNNGISYDGSRVCQLSSEFMDDILKRYSEYHSRKALNYDFAQEYNSTIYKVKYDIDWSMIRTNTQGIGSQLLNSFTFYQTEKLENKEDKKRSIRKAFTEKYVFDILKNNSLSDTEICKQIDIKNREITVKSNYIPIFYNNELVYDLLKTSEDGKVTFKIPGKYVQNPKSKRTGTFSMANGAQLSISNGGIFSFVFPRDVQYVFENHEILSNPVKFEVFYDDDIRLNIVQTAAE